jgi:HSP20 family protein
MKDSGLAVQPARDTPVRRGEPTDLVERMQNLYDRTARRAFEIFNDNGRLNGRDLADWFQAEVEFVHPVHIRVSESPAALTVRAEVPGFKANELEINVEPRRVTITGSRQTKEESKTNKTIYSETCSDEILRDVDLPAAVVPEKVRAMLKDGVLELDMPKAPPGASAGAGKRVKVESTVA